MELKEYIYAEGKNIRIVGHGFSDDEKTYPKPFIVSFTVGNGSTIFDKYEVPEEFQKVFFVVNKLGMQYMKKHPQIGNIITKKYHRFKGKEFLTGIDFHFAYNERGGELFGFPIEHPCNFDVGECAESSKDEIFNFIQELRKRRIYDKYIKALGEIVSFRALSGFDKIEEKQKQIIKK